MIWKFGSCSVVRDMRQSWASQFFHLWTTSSYVLLASSKICPHPTNEKNFSIKFSQIGDCNVPQDIINVIRPETISPGPLIFKNVRKISSGLILDTYYVWKRHAMPFLVSVWIFFFSKTLNLHALLGGFMFESPKTY